MAGGLKMSSGDNALIWDQPILKVSGTRCKRRELMTAFIQSDRRSLLLEQRKRYEAEVAEALLDEDAEEREERMRLVRDCHPMLVDILNSNNLVIYDPEAYKE
jgi:hypothetical protein